LLFGLFGRGRFVAVLSFVVCRLIRLVVCREGEVSRLCWIQHEYGFAGFVEEKLKAVRFMIRT
jgi:hypothetical protein